MKSSESILLLLALVVSCAVRAADVRVSPEPQALETTYDVLVAGGGSAGICAATASARAGAKTLLVEQSFQVGGNMTSGLVNGSGLFFAWGEQLIDGIGYELVTNAMVIAGCPFPDQSAWKTSRHSKLALRVNVPIFTAVCEEALQQAGVTILFYTSPAKAVRDGEVWTVTLHAGGETKVVRTKELVDCTGDGTLSALVGAKRLREAEHMPGTMRYYMKGLPPRETWPVEEMKREYAKAIADGSLLPNDIRDAVFGFEHFAGPLNNYVEDADTSTVEARTRTNLKGRAVMLRAYRFYKRFDAFKKLEMLSCAAETGVRETYRVEGDYLITCDDYVSGRVWDDSVCHSYYPIDMHKSNLGVVPESLKPGTKPTVPYRALLPKGVEHLLVAGRCLSSDRTANAALRVTGTCMATGQVCGEAAAMAAASGLAPRKLDVGELKRRLRKTGAIVP